MRTQTIPFDVTVAADSRGVVDVGSVAEHRLLEPAVQVLTEVVNTSNVGSVRVELELIKVLEVVVNVDELVEITNPGGAVGGREIASKTACIPPSCFTTQEDGGSVFIDAVGTIAIPIIST
jgi:hypothetical protein